MSLDWDSLLYLSAAGSVATIGLVSLATALGIRYRRELPKLPIVRSIEALELEREQLESQIAPLDEKLAKAREDIRKGEEWERWLEDRDEEIQRKKTELLEFEKDYEKLENVRDEYDGLLEAMKVLGEDQKSMESARDEAARECERLREAIPDYEEKRARHEELVRVLPALETKLKELQEEQQAVAATVDEARQSLLSLQTEQAQLSGTVEALTADKQRLLSAIEGLKDVHAAAGGAAEGEDPCEDLYRPYFTGRQAAGGTADEGARIHRMVQSLDQAGIRLPTRTLYAFHTALKNQDISPFTVLAGISGTGKSLLPSVYARCMGMHFLNLPVQPSWNSPQDLFGFYNYMEHKYKATPLAQALLQFSPYDRPLEIHEVFEDQLLLVLLDEMNLARIEYYFSELLSRLELRRSIDVSRPDERIKVEIPLEIPWGEAGEKTEVRIYPGENVLFSGTMNEDESTLSLSDKVLDRATVLRFGRPGRLLTKKPDTSQLESMPPLALTTWQQWCAIEDHTLQPEFEDYINERLSKIMAELGSPLGHRGAQSIAQYVMLYPDQHEMGMKHALSDQIEQKILPKVRGKEIGMIESPMRDLMTLVKDLDDEPLAAAIHRGLQDEHGVFMWNGLDRSVD